MKVVKYVLGVLFILGGIGSLASGAFGAGLLTAILGALFLPPISDALKEKFKFWQNKAVRYVSYIVLFGIAGAFMPKDVTSTKTSEQKVERNDVENVVEEKVEEELVINYKIENKAVIRYDKAPSYFVLINKVDLSNDKFKEDIQNLINRIVTEKGAKISIEIFDSKEALELMYQSSYGVNTLGRALNNDENKLLTQHCIASFSGELETDMYLNTLYFFPSAFQDSPEVGKYVEIKKYNPVVKDDRIVKKQRSDLEKQKAQSDKKKKKFEENCFSAIHGYNRELVRLVKDRMNDKKSFEHVNTSYTLLDDYAVVIMEFRGKNAFGAMVLNSVKAKMSYDCEVLEIVG